MTRPAGNGSSSPAPARRDTKGRLVVTPGSPPVLLQTGMSHTLCVYRPVMTVAFMLSASDHADSPYPKYVLESSDGTYHQERSAKDDLVPGDALLQLSFENLPRGAYFTLRRVESDGDVTVLFRDRPFDQIVDQARPAVRKLLEEPILPAASVVAFDGFDWTGIPDEESLA
ncbi:hypothetical protein [Archangium sp.]|uniref:hypothetical protein n=1 Tax=Archangium sp. TaxID=1872627 RepID=UPI002D4E81E5|nr:hypothetical protein [Archangium sp.]HYO54432.1 hypothetical protein [Archangium sp.]